MKTSGEPFETPAALEAYRRSGPEAQPAASADGALAGESPYERDVRAAMGRLKMEALAKIRESARPLRASEVRFSVAKVVWTAGRGKTRIFTAYPHLRREIADAQEEVERARLERRWSRPKSKADLEAVIRELKAEMERRVAAVASQQMTELREKVTPGARQRDALLAENAHLRERVVELETTHMAQTEMIRTLLQANNTKA